MTQSSCGTESWESVADEVSKALDRSPTLSAPLVMRWAGMLAVTPRAFANALVGVAAARAHAPISGFGVGAVAHEPVDNGLRLHLGANFEISGVGLGHTVHAEQAAVHSAVVAGARTIDRVSVGSAPCGRCRQFLLELGPPKELQIELSAPNEAGWSRSLEELLPNPFGPDALTAGAGVLDTTSPGGLPVGRDARGVVETAKEVAARRYAPYGRCPAGAALERSDGRVVVGHLIESVAFNPTLMPIHAALAMATFMGMGRLPVLTRAVLAESEGRVGWAEDSMVALTAVAPGVPLDVVAI